jgi:sortase (surface protein transpeptidase)
MNDGLPRQARGAGVIAVLIALTVLISLITRVAITPGHFRPTGAVPPAGPGAVPPTASNASAGPPARTALPRSTPVQMSIPAIDAASTLIPLQLNPDRTVQVPPVEKPMQAGWYSPGPTPGEIGSSVILGHVDGHSEAGIFFRLRELRPGGQVLITRQDGITARFVVYQTEQVAKDDFPTDKVYGATARPELRLITCGGAFDRQSGNYRDNVIVFAVLAA